MMSSPSRNATLQRSFLANGCSPFYSVSHTPDPDDCQEPAAASPSTASGQLLGLCMSLLQCALASEGPKLGEHQTLYEHNSKHELCIVQSCTRRFSPAACKQAMLCCLAPAASGQVREPHHSKGYDIGWQLCHRPYQFLPWLELSTQEECFSCSAQHS